MAKCEFPIWELEQLLFPPECVVCEKAGVELCRNCRPELQIRLTSLDYTLPPLLSAYEYDQRSGRILLQAKESNSRIAQLFLARTFATLLTIADRVLQRDAYLLIGLPSNPATIRRRGFVHLDRSLHRAERLSYLNLAISPLLVSSRGVRDQTELAAEERQENVSGRFRAKELAYRGLGHFTPARGIILVDDVVSTGSSMRESVRALKAAGIEPDLLLSACLGRLGHRPPSNRMSHGSANSTHHYPARGGPVNRKRSA